MKMLSFAVMVFALGATAGCADYDEPGENRVQGNRGFPCLFHEDCSAPLQCRVIEGEKGNVCSGALGLGQPCATSPDCQFLRNDLGLPLMCIEGACNHASSQTVSP